MGSGKANLLTSPRRSVQLRTTSTRNADRPLAEELRGIMKTIVIRSLVIMGIVGSISIKGASASTGPWRVAVAPDPSGTFGQFAYVATSSSDIAMYTIDPTTCV